MSKVAELTQHQRDLMHMGLCPFCEQQIKDWKPASGSFAPEWWASVREAGIDPSTGHKASCSHEEIKL